MTHVKQHIYSSCAPSSSYNIQRFRENQVKIGECRCGLRGLARHHHNQLLMETVSLSTLRSMRGESRHGPVQPALTLTTRTCKTSKIRSAGVIHSQTDSHISTPPSHSYYQANIFIQPPPTPIFL